MDNGASSYRRFQSGDDTGIVEIIKDYKDGLMFFINRYVGNIHIAEELTEEVFFRLVTKKPKYREACSFKTWLYTIGRNLAINYIKHEIRMSANLPTELADTCEPLADYLNTERNSLIYKALSAIHEDYATALYLSYFEEQSNSDIAHIMGKTRRQVENLLSRGRAALKKELIKEGYEHEEL